MSDRRTRELLERIEPPDGAEAERRAWRTIGAAFDERAAAGPGRTALRRRRRAVLALAALSVAAVLAVTPVGAAVARWLGDAFDPGHDGAEPALVALPAPGRLLVGSQDGPWIVRGDGSKRLLGPYGDADWSPRGLFLAVTRGRQLVAVEPDGDPRWALARPRRVTHPAWSPGDGYRVAYLSGDQLRVVGGDGVGDRRLAPRVARVAPAWRPTGDRLLAYADRAGRTIVVDADGGRHAWRTAPGPRPSALAWTPDGELLLSASPRGIRVHDAAGRPVRSLRPPPGASIGAIAVHPSGDRVAVVHRYAAARRSEVAAVPLRSGAARRRLAAGDGGFSGLAWSPEGRWLLIGWPDADQWLFVRATTRPQIRATANIARQFAPGDARPGAFPTVGSWCCPR